MKPLNRETAAIKQTRPLKVLQFGEGNFLRAFVDWMIDVLNEKADFNSAVQVVQPIAQGTGAMLNAQDGLYHLVLNGIQNGRAQQETRLITCVAGVINPFEDFQKYLKIGENQDLKFVVSNTTEAGITFDKSDANPNVLPNSFPGKLTVLLLHRYNYFKGSPARGLILMPCELIEKNGENLRNAVLQYINHWKLPTGFRDWINSHNTFCNTLVDRIVPGFPKDTIKKIQDETGYEDKLVVNAELFHLWVIEAPESVKNAFPTGKADLQVKFVSDLTPYRTRKVRILNGAHTAMVPVAYLAGLRTVRESIEDARVGKYVRDLVYDEIIPTLDLPTDELRQFANDVIERFQNPFIKHELSSIALNSISKYKVRVLPSVLKYIEIKKKPPQRLLFSLAALIRFYKGDWKGEAVPVNDTEEVVKFFQKAWKNCSISEVSRDTLANNSLWDSDLSLIPGVTEAVSAHLTNLEKIEVSELLDGLKSGSI